MPIGFAPKTSGHHHWLDRYSLSGRTASCIAVCWCLIFLYASWSSVGDYLNTKIADPLNFKIRDLVGKTQVLDSRIKVFAFDDKAYSQYGEGTISIESWADVLEAVVAKQPKVIVVDSMFSESPRTISEAAQAKFMRVKQTGVPVVSGSFTQDQDRLKRNHLQLSAPQYSLETYLDIEVSPKDLNQGQKQMPDWMNRKGWTAYGPSEIYEHVFDKVGHFQLTRESRVEPFLWLGDQSVIPHVAMFAADSVKFSDRNMIVNGHRVVLNSKGESPVNFVAPSQIDVHSMNGLLDKSRQAKWLSNVKAGDVVVLLPAYFTGNVDVRPSPYGFIPGGHYIVSVINSVMTGRWLQPVMVDEVLIIIFVVIFSVAAFQLKSLQYLLAFGIFSASAFACAQALFFNFGLVVPYVLPLLAGGLSGVTIFLVSRQHEERRSIIVHAALDGSVSPGQLEMVLRSPDGANLETRERIVSIMFIDIVGFSLSTEAMVPRAAFDCLKNLLGKMSAIVHYHGGVVDKTLGDGLLCYFGYRFDSDVTVSQHAEMAVRCAIEIQETLLIENLAAARALAPIFPLRIGINTASCYLGDLGSGNRVEFTVVGNGVNFAKRLEASCENNCVMIGPTTADLLTGAALGEATMEPKMIQIKHYQEPIAAWQINPIVTRKSDAEEIDLAIRERDQYRRNNGRVVLSDPNSIVLTTDLGSAQLLNYSATGVNILLDSPLAPSKIIIINFESREPGMSAALRALKVEDVEGYVCWTYASGSSFAHGIKFMNLSSAQQRDFVRILSEHAFLKPIQKVAGGF